MFLFMTSFNVIIPELNTFITDLGGAQQKGLLITLFTISAGLARPFSGKLSDTIGRKKVMIIGLIFCFIVSLLYPLSYSVGLFLMLRFFHGFGVGFLPTGATALVTDLLPENKRGQGMGIWGTFISLGIGAGQALGSPIKSLFGMENLFFLSAIIALFAGILLYFVRETLNDTQPFSFSLLKIQWKDVFEPSVFPAALVMFLSANCSGILFVLTPDMSEKIGLDNKGWFFGFYVLATVIVRIFAGTLSDRIGRKKTLVIGMSFLFISMLVVGISKDWVVFTFSSIIFGISTGITSPTLFAWTADLSHPERRGVGAGTMFIALEMGIMTGSLSTLITYDNTIESVLYGFYFAAACAFASILFLLWQIRKNR